MAEEGSLRNDALVALTAAAKELRDDGRPASDRAQLATAFALVGIGRAIVAALDQSTAGAPARAPRKQG
ncbi:MAG: hypothetical protein QOJ29_915 [Thermoleophilaceae bacterium]|nr:hypothetical protein [Thermoleophilaceae bacterium]